MDVSTVTVTANPVRLLADGRATATLIVTARDASGAAVPNQAVTLTATGSDLQWSRDSGMTDEHGVLVAKLASTAGGAKVVTATVDGVAGTSEIQFTTLAPACTGTLVLGTVPALPLMYATIAGDLDGDGTADLVGTYGAAIQVMLGNGNGTFRNGAARAFSATSTYWLALADLNADVRKDIIVATPTGLLVFLANADATYQEAIATAITLPLTNIVTGDFDDDEKVDVAVGNHVFFGRGDGTFDGPVAAGTAGQFQAQLAAADFNGDGNTDLVSAPINADLRVVISNGDRTFQAPTQVAAPEIPQNVATADVTGDGKLDIVALVVTSQSTMTSARLLLGEGNGTFQTGVLVPLSASDSLRDITVLDVDGDGDADIIGAGQLARGNGDGTFALPSYLIGTEGLASAADIDGDSANDLVFARTGSILLGTAMGVFPRLPASHSSQGELVDLDADGNVDLLTYGTMQFSAVVQRGLGDGTFESERSIPGLGPVADFDRDGIPDIVTWQGGQGGSVIARGLGNLEFELLPRLGASAQIVRAVDVDGDDRIDGLGIGSSGLEAILGNGDGTFGAVRTTQNVTWTGLVADFDRDGAVDLVSSHPVGVHYGAGDGTFEPVTQLDNSVFLASHAAGDVNGDGYIDLVGASDPAVYNPKVRLFPGNALGRFGDVEDIAMTTSGRLFIADLNNDGRLDLLTSFDATLSLRLRNAQGGFDPPLTYPVGVSGLYDVDGNGRLDVVSGTRVALQRCL